MSSSLLTLMLGKMLDNLSVYQSLGRLMDKHFTVVSLIMSFESGGSAHKKPIYWLDFEEMFVVFSILFIVSTTMQDFCHHRHGLTRLLHSLLSRLSFVDISNSLLIIPSI